MIDGRLVHAVEKLADVGRECFDVAALALGIERVKRQGRLAGAGWAGDDAEFSERNFQVEALEVVLSAAAEANGCLGWVGRAVGGGRRVG